tara:strand:- start:29 stop:208 length:180 start_codon:yes stop_codon:yes gene_type:complete
MSVTFLFNEALKYALFEIGGKLEPGNAIVTGISYVEYFIEICYATRGVELFGIGPEATK